MENANAVGNSKGTFRLAKQIASKDKTASFVQPSIDNQGNPITSNEQQLELWATFLEEKFRVQPDEPDIDLDSEEDVPPPSFDEVCACIQQLKTATITGPDEVPVEQ